MWSQIKSVLTISCIDLQKTRLPNDVVYILLYNVERLPFLATSGGYIGGLVFMTYLARPVGLIPVISEELSG